MGMNFHGAFLNGGEFLADFSSGWGLPPGLWEVGVTIDNLFMLFMQIMLILLKLC